MLIVVCPRSGLRSTRALHAIVNFSAAEESLACSTSRRVPASLTGNFSRTNLTERHIVFHVRCPIPFFWGFFFIYLKIFFAFSTNAEKAEKQRFSGVSHIDVVLSLAKDRAEARWTINRSLIRFSIKETFKNNRTSHGIIFCFDLLPDWTNTIFFKKNIYYYNYN